MSIYPEQKERPVEIAEYVIKTGATVRQASTVFGVSKSTVHKDLTERLPELSPSLYRKVRLVLEENKEQRHIRGGLATKRKYQKKKRAARG